jgi:hypothetical protein
MPSSSINYSYCYLMLCSAFSKCVYMFLTSCLRPMLVTLVLIPEVAVTRVTSHMLSRRAQMKLHLVVAFEPHEARQACKLMPDSIVVLEMIAKTPLVLERTEAEVAEDIVIKRVVDMIL